MSTTSHSDNNANNQYPSKKRGLGLFALAVICAVVVVAFVFLRDRLSLDYLADQESVMRAFQRDHPILVYVIAFSVYVAVTGLSLPGATALTLVYGWYFGFWRALILVSFASTAGATLAFLLSRYLLRSSIQNRFGERLKSFNVALDREGAFYLFTLRLIPAVPFFVINVVMGLTRINAWTFWWVSQIGMLAGTCVYVYAGASIPGLHQLADPSQLRASDISDWPELLHTMSRVSSSGPTSLLREKMDPAALTLIDKLSENNSSPDPSQQRLVVQALNELITRSDMSLLEPWRSVLNPSRQQTDKDRREARKRLTHINRSLLVRAFPDTILPPQPIISTRLLIAFALLGLFPIAAKRILKVLKRSQ